MGMGQEIAAEFPNIVIKDSFANSKSNDYIWGKFNTGITDLGSLKSNAERQKILNWWPLYAGVTLYEISWKRI
jgi:hypothetical protein